MRPSQPPLVSPTSTATRTTHSCSSSATPNTNTQLATAPTSPASTPIDLRSSASSSAHSIKPLANVYLVCGLPKDPNCWTLAQPDCLPVHLPKALPRFWRPEVLGTTTTGQDHVPGSSSATKHPSSSSSPCPTSPYNIATQFPSPSPSFKAQGAVPNVASSASPAPAASVAGKGSAAVGVSTSSPHPANCRPFPNLNERHPYATRSPPPPPSLLNSFCSPGSTALNARDPHERHHHHQQQQPRQARAPWAGVGLQPISPLDLHPDYLITKEELTKIQAKAMKLAFPREVEVIASSQQPASTTHCFSFTVPAPIPALSPAAHHQPGAGPGHHQHLRSPSIDRDWITDFTQSEPSPHQSTQKRLLSSNLTTSASVSSPSHNSSLDDDSESLPRDKVYYAACLQVWSRADHARTEAIKKTVLQGTKAKSVAIARALKAASVGKRFQARLSKGGHRLAKKNPTTRSNTHNTVPAGLPTNNDGRDRTRSSGLSSVSSHPQPRARSDQIRLSTFSASTAQSSHFTPRSSTYRSSSAGSRRFNRRSILSPRSDALEEENEHERAQALDEFETDPVVSLVLSDEDDLEDDLLNSATDPDDTRTENFFSESDWDTTTDHYLAHTDQKTLDQSFKQLVQQLQHNSTGVCHTLIHPESLSVPHLRVTEDSDEEGHEIWLSYGLILVSRFPIYDLMIDHLKINWIRFHHSIEDHSIEIKKFLNFPVHRSTRCIKIPISLKPASKPSKPSSPVLKPIESSVDGDNPSTFFVCQFPLSRDLFNPGLDHFNFTIWPLFKSLSMSHIVSIYEIGLAPMGKVVFFSKYPAMLNIAVEGMRVLLELRGWDGLSQSIVHARDVKIYLEDPGPYLLGINSQLRHIAGTVPADVMIVDIDTDSIHCSKPHPNAFTKGPVRMKIEKKLEEVLGTFGGNRSVPLEFQEAFPAGRFRPLSLVEIDGRPHLAERILPPPEWDWDQAQAILNFDGILSKVPRKGLAKILRKKTYRQAAILDPSAQHVQEIVRRHTVGFVDRRDVLETNIWKLNRKLTYLVSQSIQWKSHFESIEGHVKMLSKESRTLKARLSNETRQHRSLNGLVVQQKSRQVELENKLLETEQAWMNAQLELAKTQEIREELERQKQYMVAEMKAIALGGDEDNIVDEIVPKIQGYSARLAGGSKDNSPTGGPQSRKSLTIQNLKRLSLQDRRDRSRSDSNRSDLQRELSEYGTVDEMDEEGEDGRMTEMDGLEGSSEFARTEGCSEISGSCPGQDYMTADNLPRNAVLETIKSIQNRLETALKTAGHLDEEELQNYLASSTSGVATKGSARCRLSVDSVDSRVIPVRGARKKPAWASSPASGSLSQCGLDVDQDQHLIGQKEEPQRSSPHGVPLSRQRVDARTSAVSILKPGTSIFDHRPISMDLSAANTRLATVVDEESEEEQEQEDDDDRSVCSRQTQQTSSDEGVQLDDVMSNSAGAVSDETGSFVSAAEEGRMSRRSSSGVQEQSDKETEAATVDTEPVTMKMHWNLKRNDLRINVKRPDEMANDYCKAQSPSSGSEGRLTIGSRSLKTIGSTSTIRYRNTVDRRRSSLRERFQGQVDEDSCPTSPQAIPDEYTMRLNPIEQERSRLYQHALNGRRNVKKPQSFNSSMKLSADEPQGSNSSRVGNSGGGTGSDNNRSLRRVAQNIGG